MQSCGSLKMDFLPTTKIRDLKLTILSLESNIHTETLSNSPSKKLFSFVFDKMPTGDTKSICKQDIRNDNWFHLRFVIKQMLATIYKKIDLAKGPLILYTDSYLIYK